MKVKAQIKEQREEIESRFNDLLSESELNDCLFFSNGGLSLRVYLEKYSPRKIILFCEFRGFIVGYEYNPLKEEFITEYDKIIQFLKHLNGE